MPWPTLVVPSSGTVITTAWASSQVVDPLLWLRVLTGNADPPGPGYVVVSSGTPAAPTSAWSKITGNELAPGVAVANLGYQPANRSGDTITPNGLRVIKTVGLAGSLFSQAQLIAETPNAAVNPAETAAIGFHRVNASGVALYHDGNSLDWLNIIRNDGAIARIWTSVNDGPGSGLVAADSALHEGQTVAQIVATAAGGGVPSGVIAYCRTAAAIPAGWVRESQGDGRVLIASGTTASVAWGEAAQSGSSWAHLHAMTDHLHAGTHHVHNGPTHTHPMNHAHGTVSGTTGGATGATDSVMTAGTFRTVTDTHGHPFSAEVPGISANTGADGTGPTSNTSAHNTGGMTSGVNTATTTWAFPTYSLVLIRKA